MPLSIGADDTSAFPGFDIEGKNRKMDAPITADWRAEAQAGPFPVPQRFEVPAFLGAASMTDAQAYFERRAREERARSFSCANPIIAAARRRNAEEFQRRANAELLVE